MAKGSKKGAPSGSVGAAPSVFAAIVAATRASSFVYTSDADLVGIDPANIEVNPSMTDQTGKKATRASAAGLAAFDASGQSSAPAPAIAGNITPKAKPIFGIATVAVPMPEAKKRGNHLKPVYPFDGLIVGGSFFVLATAENPDPAKGLASTVSSATRRYAVEMKNPDGTKVMEAHTVKGKDGAADTVEQRVKMQTTRVFKVFPVEDGAPWGYPGQKGAGVWRTA